MSDKNTVTEWKVEGEVTPEQLAEAKREFDAAMFEAVVNSMPAEFKRRLLPPAPKDASHD